MRKPAYVQRRDMSANLQSGCMQEKTVAGWVLLIAGAGRNHPDRQGDLPSNFGVV